MYNILKLRLYFTFVVLLILIISSSEKKGKDTKLTNDTFNKSLMDATPLGMIWIDEKVFL